MSTSVGVSFLLPTFNRIEYLERGLPYVSKALAGKECEVLILDGSTDAEIAEKNRLICEKYGFDYKFYPSDVYTGYARLLDALDRVKYPLVQLWPDDDFINCEAAFDLAEIVTADESLVMAYGDYVNFVVKDDESELFFWSFPDLSARDYMQDSAVDRLYWTMNEGPITSFYGVTRASMLKTALLGVVEVIEHYENENFDFSFGDPLFVALLLAQGKMQHVSVPYFAKELGQSVAKFVALPGAEIFTNTDFIAKYEKIRQATLKHFPSDISEKHALAAIDAAWQSFLGGICLSPYNTWHGLQETRMEMGMSYETVPALTAPPEIVHGLGRDYWLRYEFFSGYVSEFHQLENFMVIEEWGYPHLVARRPLPAAAIAIASNFPQISDVVSEHPIPRFQNLLTVTEAKTGVAPVVEESVEEAAEAEADEQKQAETAQEAELMMTHVTRTGIVKKLKDLLKIVS